MTEPSRKKLPGRRSPVGRALFLTLISLLIVAVLTLVIWKWDTLGYVFNADRIQVKSREQTLSVLNNEDYDIYHEDENGISYRVLHGQIDVQIVFDRDKLDELHIAFDFNRLSIRTVDEAVASADLLLGPFFTRPEIEAIAVLLGSELSVHASGTSIHCTVPLAGYALRIDGDQRQGDVNISLT